MKIGNKNKSKQTVVPFFHYNEFNIDKIESYLSRTRESTTSSKSKLLGSSKLKKSQHPLINVIERRPIRNDSKV